MKAKRGQNRGLSVFNQNAPNGAAKKPPRMLNSRWNWAALLVSKWCGCDAHIRGVLHQNKSSPSKQESTALNQSSKAWNWLSKSPRAVVVTVIAPGWLGMFDPGKGQLC